MKAFIILLFFCSEAFAGINVWNPDMPVGERFDFEESTLLGCVDPKTALVYKAVCAQESGYRFIWNADGAGYSGTKWATLIKAAQRHGMKRPIIGWRAYFKINRKAANLYGAKAFKDWCDTYTKDGQTDYRRAVMVWHRGNRRCSIGEADARAYYRNVLQILGRMVVQQ